MKPIYTVTFLYPGAFCADTSTVEVQSLDPSAVVWPERAYAFTLHQRQEITCDGQVFKGETTQIGPTYYHPDSKVESLDEVKLNPKATSILISNMGCNGWTHIIWSRWGGWPQPFDASKMEILKA